MTRDLLRRSSVGAIFDHERRVAVHPQHRLGRNQYGVDGTCRLLRQRAHQHLLGEDPDPRTSRTTSATVPSSTTRPTRYAPPGGTIGRRHRLTPTWGSMQRDDFERSFGSFRFSPRPRSIAAIRKFSWSGQLDYIDEPRGGARHTRSPGAVSASSSRTATRSTSPTRAVRRSFSKSPFRSRRVSSSRRAATASRMCGRRSAWASSAGSPARYRPSTAASSMASGRAWALPAAGWS